MIQHPIAGEVVVDVPGQDRALVDFHRDTIARVFRRLLARGTSISTPRGRAIQWQLDGSEEIDPMHPSVVAAKAQLLEAAAEAEATARELDDILRRHADPTRPLRIPSELARRMGGMGTQDFVFKAEAEVRPIRDALHLASRSVRLAVGRDSFRRVDEKVFLFGWGFLPPGGMRAEPRPLASVSLELLENEVQQDRVIQALRWRTGGPVTEVELVRVDGPESVIDRSRRVVDRAIAEGLWRFPLGDLTPGSEYVARARGSWGSVTSDRVRMPEAARRVPVVPPVPPPEEPVSLIPPFDEPVISPEPPDPPPPEEEVPPPPPEPARHGCLRRFLPWILLALLLMLLGCLLWIFLPVPRFEWWLPRVAEHLPHVIRDRSTTVDVPVVPRTPDAGPGTVSVPIVIPSPTTAVDHDPDPPAVKPPLPGEGGPGVPSASPSPRVMPELPGQPSPAPERKMPSDPSRRESPEGSSRTMPEVPERIEDQRPVSKGPGPAAP